MTIMFRLEPLIAPQEKLKEDLRRRPPISVAAGITTVVIGRGSLTGIADHSIGKNVFSLTVVDESNAIKATLLKDSDKCRVHINGRHWQGLGATRYLRNGDFLSLDNLRYEYKLFSMNASSSSQQATVELLSNSSQASLNHSLDDEKEASAATKSVPCSPSLSEPNNELDRAASSPAPITLSKDLANRLSEDIQCSICLEIQIHSQTLVPCGHSLCSPCLVGSLVNCPVCRAPITSRVKSRQLDGLISNLVAVPGLLDAEDVQHYHVRKQQHAPTPSPVPSKQRAAKRIRRTPTTLHPADHPGQVASAPHPNPFQPSFFAGIRHERQLRQQAAILAATNTATGGASVLDAIYID